jgi:hypothetical protein
MVHMWIDERGSEVLMIPECRRMLALGAKQGRHGQLGIPQEGAPLVLPVDYAVHGPDVVIRIGEGMFSSIPEGALVSFQVDGVDGERLWSVLVRGLAIEEDLSSFGLELPMPRVAEPGNRLVRIRSDVVTGRRFGPSNEE